MQTLLHREKRAELSSVHSTLPWVGPFPSNIPQNFLQGLGPQSSFGAEIAQVREQNLGSEQIQALAGRHQSPGVLSRTHPCLWNLQESGRKGRNAQTLLAVPELPGFSLLGSARQRGQVGKCSLRRANSPLEKPPEKAPPAPSPALPCSSPTAHYSVEFCCQK